MSNMRLLEPYCKDLFLIQLQRCHDQLHSDIQCHGKTWLLDSRAFHNITSDLANLTTRLKYDGTEEVILGNGSGLQIYHTGSLSLKFSKKTFCLPIHYALHIFVKI
jgi:hypothetical protein